MERGNGRAVETARHQHLKGLMKSLRLAEHCGAYTIVPSLNAPQVSPEALRFLISRMLGRVRHLLFFQHTIEEITNRAVFD